MTKTGAIIFLTVMFLYQVNCNNPASSADSSVDTRIYGSWRWISTIGGVAGVNYSPPPDILINVNKNGILSIYRNDTLLAIRNYEITYEKLDYLSNTLNILRFSDTLRNPDISYKDFSISIENTYQINNDTLRIWDIIYDGYFYCYKKVN